jgi:hypothetical protein
VVLNPHIINSGGYSILWVNNWIIRYEIWQTLIFFHKQGKRKFCQQLLRFIFHLPFILCCNQQNNGHLNGSNIVAEFYKQKVTQDAMENITGDVSMSYPALQRVF